MSIVGRYLHWYTLRMLSTSLEQVMAYAKEHHIPRVIEIRCPRERCQKTFYALTDSNAHEHLSWLEGFKRERKSRHIYCKHCHYGALSDHEGDFLFITHTID